jgi:hypothetical protein
MKKLGLIFGVLFPPYLLFSYTFFTPSGEGFCGNFSPFAKGVDAGILNPGNLIFSPEYSVNILTLGIEYSLDMTIWEYLKLFSGILLSDKEKERIRKVRDMKFIVGIGGGSFSYKTIGFNFSFFSYNTLHIPQDVMDLVLYGNERDEKYNLSGLNGEILRGLSFKFSFAHKIGEYCGMGYGVKILNGNSYYSVKEVNGYLETIFDKADRTWISGKGEMTIGTAEGGNGVAIDIGSVYYLGGRKFILSIYAQNVISVMFWSNNSKEIKSSFILDTTDLEKFKPDTTFQWKVVETRNKVFTTALPLYIGIDLGKEGKKFKYAIGIGYPQFIGGGLEYLVWRGISVKSGIGYRYSRWWLGVGIGYQRGIFKVDSGVRWSSWGYFSVALGVNLIPSE